MVWKNKKKTILVKKEECFEFSKFGILKIIFLFLCLLLVTGLKKKKKKFNEKFNFLDSLCFDITT